MLGQRRTSVHEAKNCHRQVRGRVCRGLARRGRETGHRPAHRGLRSHLLVTAARCHEASGRHPAQEAVPTRTFAKQENTGRVPCRFGLLSSVLNAREVSHVPRPFCHKTDGFCSFPADGQNEASSCRQRSQEDGDRGAKVPPRARGRCVCPSATVCLSQRPNVPPKPHPQTQVTGVKSVSPQ